MFDTIVEDKMKVTYSLPPGIKGFRYVPNHHFVELEDAEGRIIHMPASSLLRAECSAGHVFFVTFNSGQMLCPHCGASVQAQWGKMQVAFIPEKESDFEPPLQLDEKKD